MECYGRPLLDLLNNIRKKLPGMSAQNQLFPDNLWIFGIPLTVSNDDFGLPLIKSTYRNWCSFPKGEAPEFEFDESTKVLTIELMLNHNIPKIATDYFK
jgi:hypothetical protein